MWAAIRPRRASRSRRTPINRRSKARRQRRSSTVFDLDPGGPSELVYSTYVSGSSAAANSGVNAIAVDSSGNIYATGYTTDANFPVTAGAFQSKFGGTISTDTGNVTGDAFVLKLNPTAQGPAQLKYSSFFGGVGNEGRDGPRPRPDRRRPHVDRREHRLFEFAGDSGCLSVLLRESRESCEQSCERFRCPHRSIEERSVGSAVCNLSGRQSHGTYTDARREPR